MRKLPVQKRPARKLLGAVVAAALLIPNAGFTLGLGEIEVNSALNQKLNADIELLSASPEDTETLIVKLASRKEFTRAGLDRPYSLNDLRFKSVIIDDVPHIKVFSGGPIREPFLNFLVEIDWPNGHLLREYTVLLDPPVFMTQSASVTTSQSGGAPTGAGFRPGAGSTSNVVPVVTTPDAATSARPGAAMQAPLSQPAQTQAIQQPTWVPAAPVIQQSNTINQPAGSYKIKAGDTAWSLADAMRPDQSITVPQMMVAMLRANPESFINENINGLKRGYILRVPDYNQITTISNADALALVREQAALWRQYQQSQSGGQPVSAMQSDDSGVGIMSADVESAAEDDAYLEIVSAGSGSSTMSGKDPTQMSALELRAELAFARERVETELVEKEALQQRIESLQQNVDKMKGMLSIEDTELAEAQSPGQSGLEGIAENELVEDDVVGDMPMDDADEAMMADGSVEAEFEQAMFDEAGIDETAFDEAEGDGEGIAEDALFVDEAAITDDIAMSEQAESAVDDFIAPEMSAEPQIVKQEPADPLTQLLNNPMMLAAAGGGLLLIVALIGLFFKRRKSAAEKSAMPAMDGGFDDLESLADDIAGEVDDVEETVLLSGDEIVADSFDSESTMILDSADDTVVAEPEPEADAAADDDGGTRDDVIAEADVYLAYGIYQQAEELLSQAITDNPDRDDYRVKLAETHYAGKNADAFVEVATDLQQRVRDDSPSWKKVMSMGQNLCADNPMFQGSVVGIEDVGAAVSQDTPEMDFDLGADGDVQSSDLDLSLDDDSLKLPGDDAEEVLEPADELEFDLSDADAVEETDSDDDDDFSLDIEASELDIESDGDALNNDEESLDLSNVDIGLVEVLDDGGADNIDDISNVEIDFGLDDAEQEVEAALDLDDEELSLDLTEEVAALDMDLDDDNTLLETAVETEIEEPVTEIEAAPVVEAVEDTAVIRVDIDDEEDFDLSSLDDVDEVGTKLDLARAYLDMGDHEGTKSILEEVIADGSDEQKQEANELMAKLG